MQHNKAAQKDVNGFTARLCSLLGADPDTIGESDDYQELLRTVDELIGAPAPLVSRAMHQKLGIKCTVVLPRGPLSTVGAHVTSTLCYIMKERPLVVTACGARERPSPFLCASFSWRSQLLHGQPKWAQARLQRTMTTKRTGAWSVRRALSALDPPHLPQDAHVQVLRSDTAASPAELLLVVAFGCSWFPGSSAYHYDTRCRRCPRAQM